LRWHGFSHHALSVQPLHSFPAGLGLGLRREQAEDQLPEQVFIGGCLPDVPEIHESGLDLRLYRIIKLHQLLNGEGKNLCRVVHQPSLALGILGLFDG
jgi:hypothetical protein